MRTITRGFTIIELILVAAIMTVVLSIVLVGFGKVNRISSDARTVSNMKQIQLALSLYYENNGGFPSCPGLGTPGQPSAAQICCIGTNKCYLAGQEYNVDLSTITALLDTTNLNASQLAGTLIPSFGSSVKPVADSSGNLNGPYVYICATLDSSGLCPTQEASVAYTVSNGSVVTIPAGDVDAVVVPDTNVTEDAVTPTGGCTDKTASNYEPSAAYNNGSCQYSSNISRIVLGCTDNTALNYSSIATVNNGSCNYSPNPVGCGYYLECEQKSFYNCGKGWHNQGTTPGVDTNFYDGTWYRTPGSGCGWHTLKAETTPTAPSIVYGCPDKEAFNYNAEANVNNGTCKYVPQDKTGCTDPDATNYEPGTIYDDGSCQYSPTPADGSGSTALDVGGCTSNSATNYTPQATYDNGSCTYSSLPYGCGYYLDSKYMGFYNCGNGWNSTGLSSCGNYYNGTYYSPTFTCGFGWSSQPFQYSN